MTVEQSALERDALELLSLLDEAVGRDEAGVLVEYLEHVANARLIELKRDDFLQHGKKGGQSLYSHILDGIFVLEQLRTPLRLSELEARVLFTAYTIHDINKLLPESAGLSRDATPEQIAAEISHYGLDVFFPQASAYLWDITTLVRGHPGHTAVSGEALNRRNAARYGLGLDRVLELRELVRALDVVDLAHSLNERTHHNTFLSHLNRFALTLGVQYELFSHRLDESRGALTNLFHNAIGDYLRERYGALPLLLYPDGAIYLVERGATPSLQQDDLSQIAARAVGELARMTGEKFEQFIEVRPLGIKVDAKCLELGRPFDDIWQAIRGIVERRSFKIDELTQKAIERSRASFAKNAAHYPKAATAVEARLAEGPIARTAERLRLGELVRSYLIFLGDHFAAAVPEPWQRIYDLLEIAPEERELLAFFDARLDRAYALARDLTLSMEEVYSRLLEDGRALLAARTNADPRAELFAAYLARHTLFGDQVRITSATDGASHYVTNQHRQCVQCSDPFPTAPWMAADVRSGITVQTFSNRLRGGPGEPKKYICAICQAQYLVERLSYPEIRGEHTIYLHLLPYAYLTAPFVTGLRRVLRRIGEQEDVRALWLDGDRAMMRYIREQQVRAPMLTRTRQKKPHSYGIYVPSYAEALIGNLLIFPLNPAGETDTERFLFALEYALILQRYFGCRVVLSASAVIPFDPDSASDLMTDMTPLSCRGLIDTTSYRQFKPGTDQKDNLHLLWKQMASLYTIKRVVSTGQDDPLPELVQALALHPLGIFYVTEKLIEARIRGDRKARSPEWQAIHITAELRADVEALALSKGGRQVELLSTHMRRLAEIAWQSRLIGRTLAKNSLMTALDEVLRKLTQRSKAVEQDTDALRAAIVEDIFEYLERVSERRYRPGQRRWDAIKEFVDIFFTGIYAGVYGNNVTRLLSDEKLLRSTFLFYMREQIPRKLAEAAEQGGEIEIDDEAV